MTEALYRGKRLTNGRWIEGYYTFLGGFGSIWLEQNGAVLNFTVDPETVGPWTGKTDVNGVRIFEGDLITCTTWVWETNDFRESKPALVVYNTAHAAFEYAWPEWPDVAPGTLDDEIKWEVVGNVHDLRKEAET